MQVYENYCNKISQLLEKIVISYLKNADNTCISHNIRSTCTCIFYFHFIFIYFKKLHNKIALCFTDQMYRFNTLCNITMLLKLTYQTQTSSTFRVLCSTFVKKTIKFYILLNQSIDRKIVFNLNELMKSQQQNMLQNVQVNPLLVFVSCLMLSKTNMIVQLIKIK